MIPIFQSRIKVIILSYTPRFCRNYDELYPVYKWHKELYNSGIVTTVIYKISDVFKASADVIILTSRYFAGLDKETIINMLIKLKDNYKKIFWFDVVDTSGSDTFWIMPYIDVFLKKQVLRDRDKYSVNEHDKSVRVWLKDRTLTTLKYSNYVPCDSKYLNKIAVAWNIGCCNYKVFYAYTDFFRNYYFANTSFKKPEYKRNLFLSFRGSVSYDDNVISYQRNEILKILDSLQKKYNILLGGKVSTTKFINELKNSKISISPFGWGEICYRDFESILAGCILLKPDMTHIETWPDVYIENKSYIPVDWNLTDLESNLDTLFNSYLAYLPVAKYAQEIYLETIMSSDAFIKQFHKIIES